MDREGVPRFHPGEVEVKHSGNAGNPFCRAYHVDVANLSAVGRGRKRARRRVDGDGSPERSKLTMSAVDTVRVGGRYRAGCEDCHGNLFRETVVTHFYICLNFGHDIARSEGDPALSDPEFVIARP